MNPAPDQTPEQDTKSRQAERLPSKEICQAYADFFRPQNNTPTVDPDEEIPFKE